MYITVLVQSLVSSESPFVTLCLATERCFHNSGIRFASPASTIRRITDIIRNISSCNRNRKKCATSMLPKLVLAARALIPCNSVAPIHRCSALSRVSVWCNPRDDFFPTSAERPHRSPVSFRPKSKGLLTQKQAAHCVHVGVNRNRRRRAADS